MVDSNYIVVIMGKSASGKDTIARILSNQYGYKQVVSTTSRPMRSNEVNHEDYHFVSSEEFIRLKERGRFIEYRYYDTIQNGVSTRWHYGIERSEIDMSKCSYVCVVDKIGLKDIQDEFGGHVISIYVDAPEEKRKIRAIGRDMNFEEEEWIRRNKDDDVKFNGIELKADIVVENYDLDKCVDDMLLNIRKQKDIRKFFTQYASY